jgi:hypothetical protein
MRCRLRTLLIVAALGYLLATVVVTAYLISQQSNHPVRYER